MGNFNTTFVSVKRGRWLDFPLLNLYFNTTFVSVKHFEFDFLTLQECDFNTTFVSVKRLYNSLLLFLLILFQYNLCIGKTIFPSFTH